MSAVALQRGTEDAGGNQYPKKQLLLEPRPTHHGATHISLPVRNQEPVASISNHLIRSRIP